MHFSNALSLKLLMYQKIKKRMQRGFAKFIQMQFDSLKKKLHIRTNQKPKMLFANYL